MVPSDRTWRKHYEEADAVTNKGARGREEERVDVANVVWPEVTGLCGFWDGSCQHGFCGAGMLIKIFTQTLRTRARPELPRC